jgi:hypothetical protein
MPDTLDRTLNLKMSGLQLRACKAAAKLRGKHLATWARETLLEQAVTNLGVRGFKLAAPTLPETE